MCPFRGAVSEAFEATKRRRFCLVPGCPHLVEDICYRLLFDLSLRLLNGQLIP